MNLSAQISFAFRENLPYKPLPQQEKLIDKLSEFIASQSEGSVFLLKGYAGTGKTSMTAAFVKAMYSLKKKCVLLAPTGRAAKVFSSFAGVAAYTIHKRIFRPIGANTDSYFIAKNNDRNTLFIVDEASMLGDSPDNASLLKALIGYVYSSEGCSMILIGDTAQLPPVGQTDSPAMNISRLKSLGLNPVEYVLSEPVRQASNSGILYNATRLRLLLNKGFSSLPSIITSRFADIIPLSSEFFLEVLSDSYSSVGQEETIVITRSNRIATELNRAIRARVMYADSELQQGDRLVISKNNYFWSRSDKEFEFIANGEIATVEWFGKTYSRYGYRFVETELKFAGKETPITALLILNNLVSEYPAMPNSELKSLLDHIVKEDETEASELSKEIKAMHSNPYYNALQVKYAYALTCHKAQGGQWKHVYIDLSYINPELVSSDFLRWLYTALTRASDRVYLINPSLKCK